MYYNQNSGLRPDMSKSKYQVGQIYLKAYYVGRT